MQYRRTIQAAEAFVNEFHHRAAKAEAEIRQDAPLVEPSWARAAFDEGLVLHAPPEEDTIPLAEAMTYLTLPVALPDDERTCIATAEIDAPSTNGGQTETDNDSRAALDRRWAEMRQHFGQGDTLQARVIGWNKGGLLVMVENLQGFIPASQLIRFPRYLGMAEREAYLAEQKGAELRVRVIELDQDRNRLVLSERACFWANRAGDSSLCALQSGQVVEGIVSNLCDFGAFVDLGEIDGLIHISELSWGRITHPSEMLKVGDRVRVYVLEVNEEQKRIALSLKRLRPDPWQKAEERYQPGQLVRGVITNIVGFGAFARVEDGLEGLIHISELADGDVKDPHHVVHEGQEITVRVLHVDGSNRRLALSLRRATGPAISLGAQPGMMPEIKE